MEATMKLLGKKGRQLRALQRLESKRKAGGYHTQGFPTQDQGFYSYTIGDLNRIDKEITVLKSRI